MSRAYVWLPCSEVRVWCKNYIYIYISIYIYTYIRIYIYVYKLYIIYYYIYAVLILFLFTDPVFWCLMRYVVLASLNRLHVYSSGTGTTPTVTNNSKQLDFTNTLVNSSVQYTIYGLNQLISDSTMLQIICEFLQSYGHYFWSFLLHCRAPSKATHQLWGTDSRMCR